MVLGYGSEVGKVYRLNMGRFPDYLPMFIGLNLFVKSRGLLAAKTVCNKLIKLIIYLYLLIYRYILLCLF
jgi:hypothetical protein